jgi:Fe-S cluster biogenesis protein NfuA
MKIMNGVDRMKEKVQKAINEIRPNLQADGGDVELVEVMEDGTVKVKLLGACRGCPMSQMTLKMGIEKYLKKEVPGVREVVSVP